MFEIINELGNDIPECEDLEKYVKYLVKELALEKCEFNIIYKDGNNEKEVRLPIETPVSYYNFSSLKNNNIVFLINTSNVKFFVNSYSSI